MSLEEPWYAGFDVIDLSTTPVSEMPEEAGFHLICPIDGCDMEERFDYLPEIADSEWTEMSIKDQILTDGFTLKEAYCPGHSLEQNKTNASAVSGKDSEAFVSEMNGGLGMPLDSSENQQHPYHNNPEYARFDFAEDGVLMQGMLVACGADSCYNEAETTDIDQLEKEGWVGGNWIGLLANGLILFEGCCPEHS
jgi:hypothetical protein